MPQLVKCPTLSLAGERCNHPVFNKQLLLNGAVYCMELRTFKTPLLIPPHLYCSKASQSKVPLLFNRFMTQSTDAVFLSDDFVMSSSRVVWV